MNAQTQQLMQAVLALPYEDKQELAELLAVDLHGSPPNTMSHEELLVELDRRCAEHDAGQVRGLSWAEVRARGRREVMGLD